MVQLVGSTWDHARGLDPMLAATELYRTVEPDVEIRWEVRSLLDFGNFSVAELAKRYDLMVIDHPHLGDALREKALVAFGAEAQRAAESETVGPSARSYVFEGRCLALPVDAASQMSAHRPDLMDAVPRTWDEVVAIADDGGMLWSLRPLDAICSFLSLAASRGTPAVDETGAFMAHGDAVATLDLMRAVSDRVPPWCLHASPIDVLDRLAADQDDDRYTPVVFGYTNYSRTGFAARPLAFDDLPGVSGSGGALLGGAGIAVSSASESVAAATRFAEWVAGAEVQRGVYTEAGGQPAAAAAWDDDHANAMTGDFFRRVRGTLEASWLRPRTTGFPAWQVQAGDIVHAGLTGSVTSPDAARRLERAYHETRRAEANA